MDDGENDLEEEPPKDDDQSHDADATTSEVLSVSSIDEADVVEALLAVCDTDPSALDQFEVECLATLAQRTIRDRSRGRGRGRSRGDRGRS